MKKLIQRLSRVADSTHYSLLRSESRNSTRTRYSSGVPEGHLPVYVGDESARFVVSAELLNHPIFMLLLDKSAQEYGYEQKGVLRIPCRVFVFERVLEALRIDEVSTDVMELLSSFSDEFMTHVDLDIISDR